MSEPRKIIADNVGVMPPNSNPNSKGNDIPIYMSLQGLLYQAMADAVNCLEKERIAFFDAYAKGACIYGGLTLNADGTISIDKDSSGKTTGGLLGTQMQFGIDSAKDQAQASRNDAWGSFGAAIASGVSLLSTVGFAIKTRTTPEQSELQTLYSSIGEDLSSPPNAELKSVGTEKVATEAAKLKKAEDELNQLMTEAQSNPAATEQQRAERLEKINIKTTEIVNLKEQIKGFEAKINKISVSKDEYAKFAKELKSSEDQTAANYNKKVLEHLKFTQGDSLNQVKKNNEDLQNNVEKEIQKQNEHFQNAVRTADIFAQTGSKGSESGGKMASATNGQKAQEEKTVGDIQTQLNQTYQAFLKQQTDQTSTLQNEASQIAGSYAQWGRA